MVNKPKLTQMSDKMRAFLEDAGGVETRSHEEYVEWQKNNPEDGNWITGPRRW